MPEPSTANFDMEMATAIDPILSRRDFLATASAGAAGGFALAQGPARAPTVRTDIARLSPYGNSTIPSGIRSRAVGNVNGLTVHMLEAGYEPAGRPAGGLVSGFQHMHSEPVDVADGAGTNARRDGGIAVRRKPCNVGADGWGACRSLRQRKSARRPGRRRRKKIAA